MKPFKPYKFQVILFDGVCNFCNSTINFVIRKEKYKTLKFAAMQSTAGTQLLEQYNFPPEEMRSFIFIENGIAYNKSSAALRVCKYLKGAWPLLFAFIIVPPFIRNAVYDYVAKNRYKWFGIQEKCMIPTPALKVKFLV